MAPATLTVDEFGRERVRWAVPKMIASDLSGLMCKAIVTEPGIRSTTKPCSSWFKARK